MKERLRQIEPIFDSRAQKIEELLERMERVREVVDSTPCFADQELSCAVREGTRQAIETPVHIRLYLE